MNSKNKLEKDKYEWLNANTQYGSSFHGKKFLPLIRKIITHYNCDSLLDVGTGQGQFCESIRQCCDKVIGLDWCIDQPEHIKNKDITFISSDAVNMPLEDNSVDITTSFDFFEHIIPDHVELVIKEMTRVTKKILIHNINTSQNPTSSHRGDLEKMFGDGELHQTKRTRGWWEELFSKYGHVLKGSKGLNDKQLFSEHTISVHEMVKEIRDLQTGRNTPNIVVIL
jgi:ubiquinone/menaquinone biosynthesis C-methylase UbiE